VGVEDRPGVAAELFEKIADKNISVDMIVQGVASEPSRASITFTLPKTDLTRARPWIEETARSLGARQVLYDEDVVKVSIVGLGMRSHAGIAAKMFRIFAKEGINIQAISTSEIKVSCLVAAKYTELAVRALHDGFGLDKG
jgi:aspartate kinase